MSYMYSASNIDSMVEEGLLIDSTTYCLYADQAVLGVLPMLGVLAKQCLTLLS